MAAAPIQTSSSRCLRSMHARRARRPTISLKMRQGYGTAWRNGCDHCECNCYRIRNDKSAWRRQCAESWPVDEKRPNLGFDDTTHKTAAMAAVSKITPFRISAEEAQTAAAAAVCHSNTFLHPHSGRPDSSKPHAFLNWRTNTHFL